MVHNTSIKENIRYGKLDATDEEVYKAALRSNAVGFIEGEQADMRPEEEEKFLQDKFKEKLD